MTCEDVEVEGAPLGSLHVAAVPCGCVVEYGMALDPQGLKIPDAPPFRIVYCPTHASAFRLADLVRRSLASGLFSRADAVAEARALIDELPR